MQSALPAEPVAALAWAKSVLSRPRGVGLILIPAQPQCASGKLSAFRFNAEQNIIITDSNRLLVVPTVHADAMRPDLCATASTPEIISMTDAVADLLGLSQLALCPCEMSTSSG